MIRINKRFDLDLKFGQKCENEFQSAAQGTVECKADRLWCKTSNVFIEKSYKGEPSGIDVTEAKNFAVCFHVENREHQIWLLYPTELLKKFVIGYPIKKGGDNWQSEGYIVPAKDLLDFKIQEEKFNECTDYGF